MGSIREDHHPPHVLYSRTAVQHARLFTFTRPRWCRGVLSTSHLHKRQGRGRQPRHRHWHKHWHGTGTGEAHCSIVALPRARPRCHTTALLHCRTAAGASAPSRMASAHRLTTAMPHCAAALYSAGTTSHRLHGPCGTDGVVGARGPRDTDGRWSA